MHKSIWTNQDILKEFEPLKGSKKTDILIIGGGISGILCAYFLKQKGIDYILVEGNKIASGITKNTTAKITLQHSLIYNKLISEFGFEKAQMYLTANRNALEAYKRICKNIECDFEIKNSYTYSMDDRRKTESEVKAVNSLGYEAEFIDDLPLPFKPAGSICIKEQAQFNPLKFISHISKNLNIFENTFIRDITSNYAKSDNGKIKFNKAIICTHFPFINKHGSYFLKLYQHRSYVSAYNKAPKLNGMYVDESKKGLSFRNYGNFLLIGGGSHRTGKYGGGWHEINNFTKKFYPDAKLKYEWSTQDCMSLDGVPYIGRYSTHTPQIYVATGFNKWGMSSSMAAAEILSNMIIDKTADYAEVFSPQRSILKPQLLINGFETTMNLITPTTKRCPHLGCALKWNKKEHSWDCPCHGSRFDENGKLIDNPAMCDLE